MTANLMTEQKGVIKFYIKIGKTLTGIKTDLKTVYRMHALIKHR